MDNSNLIYHYTSFEKLQCILKYGTLRFKESTSSNDILDTIGFENILKSMPNFNAPGATAALLKFIINYYRWEGYHPSAKFLVACFSKIPDSRLLWDAYTMHRPGNQKCPHGEEKYCSEVAEKYNGGVKYYDVEIPADCIDHIILGPEFDESSFAEIDSHPEYKFKFVELIKSL